jgi:hypothetical protein
MMSSTIVGTTDAEKRHDLVEFRVGDGRLEDVRLSLLRQCDVVTVSASLSLMNACRVTPIRYLTVMSTS